MNSVPKMISTKDLSYIEDMANWHLIILNKLKLYVCDITDNTILSKFKDLIDMHTKFVYELSSMLENGEK